MEFIIGAASWALTKALASTKDSLAETWAASKGIGDNLDAFEMELLQAQWILDNPHVKQTRSPQLTELLVKLRQVAYDADDVLDELDYYRIQDDLDGTQHATDVDGDGGGLLLHARSTANAIGKRLTCCSFPSADDDSHTRVLEEDPNTPAKGWGFLSYTWPSRAQQRKHDVQTQKLRFDRVDMSTKMKNIVDKLKPLCAKLNTIIDTELLGSANFRLEQLATNPLLGTSSYSTHGNAMNRATTSPEIIEQRLLYGRDNLKEYIVNRIIKGEYSTNQLTVLPIVGPGGIGKTTLIEHIYKQVKRHFDISIWICVSINFNAHRLLEEIVKQIPRVDGERATASVQQLIEQRLKAKKILLVLDDVWSCTEDGWQKLLAPFKNAGGEGNMIIVTTRFPFVADTVKTVDCSVDLKCLNPDEFMSFFEVCVFGYTRPWEEHAELREVGEKIVVKLKGFPLAAKAVGRLLGNQLTLDHWISVLESREWEQTYGNDIMPALKLSYDYLPFHLQQCFSYLAMFPEDYEFGREELIYLWMGLDILNSHDANKRAQDIGQSYLIDLVNYGFLKYYGSSDYGWYVVHDLIHELAMKVQSKECIRIHRSNIMSIKIPPSIRHLSIIVDDTDVKDRVSFECYTKDLSTLDRRLKIQKLRTLMLFGEHHGSFAKTFGDLFRNARALRTICLNGASYAVEDILYNFSRLVHLRYLKIDGSLYNEGIGIPALCRLYHLHLVDLHRCKCRLGSTRSISNLGNLRHFLVQDDALYSGILEVGKLKQLQELRSFEVGKESKGFELSQLEQLSELGGSLAICNLERTQTVKEAGEAKLICKYRLDKLTLEWDVSRLNKDPKHEANILEVMKPHINLRAICIRGHGGTNCPKWLGENLSINNLESLHLDDVPWVNLPPIGELWMVNEHGEEHLDCVPHKRFLNLRRLELNKLPRLKKWANSDPCNLFSHLEVLIVTDCSELTELSFSHCICCQQEKEEKINWFPRLQELEIENCPKLLSFPPVPWTRAPCSVNIEGVGSGLERLVCKENYKSEYSLEIKMEDALVSELWNVLSFDNLTELKELTMDTCPPLPQHHLQMLSSLKTLRLYDGSSIVFPLVEGESHTESESLVECITVTRWGSSAKELTQLLTYFPKLSELNIMSCKKITGLVVVEKQGTQTLMPATSDNRGDGVAEFEKHQQHDGTRGEEEISASSAEGLLLLPSQLQELWIDCCPELSLQSSPVDQNKEAGRTGGGQGLQGLCSLRSLEVTHCPRFLSSYLSSSSSSCPPFPTSLEHLYLRDMMGTATALPLSNLTSLTDLSIQGCGDLRGEGLWHLLTQGRLTKLIVTGTPNFIAGPEPPLPHEQEFPSSSSKLQELETDDVAGVLAPPICTLLSSSLTELRFWGDEKVERFTKEQEEALQLLTSLEEIEFWACNKLQCLPAGLHGLPNLKRLHLWCCAAIRSVPKDSLPISLQELEINDCPAIQSLPKGCLPTSLQKLEIESCPAIRSLPKDCLPSSLQKLVIKYCPAIRSFPKVNDLPSSLQELNVVSSGNEELRRQCRKLIGIIPVVYA